MLPCASGRRLFRRPFIFKGTAAGGAGAGSLHVRTFSQRAYEKLFSLLEKWEDYEQKLFAMGNGREFKRFLTRGRTNISTELYLLCLGYNLNKLWAKCNAVRLQTHLFCVQKESFSKNRKTKAKRQC
jgi:hypothetical protein